MLKKITSKLKALFGSNTKSVIAPANISTKESKSLPHEHKPYLHEKASGTHLPRKQFKKETREEYRLRHEKLEQKQQFNKKPLQIIPSEPWDDIVFKVPVVDGKTRFHDLDMSKEILHAVFDLGFQYCTKVQAETLPKSLVGDDVTAQAQTGTGKTAAFLITIFDHILKNPLEKKSRHGTPRALILAPTRELVLQIEKDAHGLGMYVPCSILSLLGGIDYMKQQNVLRNETCDILICTPGRLIDFMKKRLVDLSKVEILIIDEADRMLDMGFIPSVKQIVINTPQKAKRQTMFFSATLTGDVKRLAESWTRQAFEVTIEPEEVAVQSIEQITYITTVAEKPTLLYNLIMQKNLERVLVFVNRKDHARRLKETFEMYGISCALLSGDVEQTQRIKRLEKFRDGKVRVLVATDVASRGIHVEAISHVINYNMPQDVEEYVHRIGRTGRAGATGISINFADEEDSHELHKLEEFLNKKISCIFPEDSLLIPIPEMYRKIIPQKYQKRKFKK
ncbi:MAG: DEAD/DEAH box helicase [Ignavibacteriales bacterium]|nr:DEAD/DEAH box helicase [Ignavibacteriales bacterium]